MDRASRRARSRCWRRSSPGALRFSLTQELQARDVPVRSHRPSRTLREEPATQCLLTIAALCHPSWGIVPAKSDVAHALMLAIDELDLVRAQLLAEIAYRVRDGVPHLLPFVEIEPAMQERITFLLGGRYEGLRTWVAAHGADDRPKTTDEAGLVRRRRRSVVLRPVSIISSAVSSASCFRSRATASTATTTPGRSRRT